MQGEDSVEIVILFRLVTLMDVSKKNKLPSTFRFKYCIPDLHLLPLISFIVASALNPIMVNVLENFSLRIGGHIRNQNIIIGKKES